MGEPHGRVSLLQLIEVRPATSSLLGCLPPGRETVDSTAMGLLARIGYEWRRKRSEQVAITTCPNGHDLTEEDVVDGVAGNCPVCSIDLFPGKGFREAE